MRKSLFIGLVAILSLFGCSRHQEIDIPDANLSLFARTESPAESRTVVESGVHVYWEPGDEIAVFMGDKSAKFTTDITAASGTATFKGTFGDSEWPEELDLWAVYPYSEDAVFDGETITTTLPSEQVAREGSFGKDMNLAIAHSSGTTLQFYNVGGGIRFSVTEEGIKKVMFEGLSGEIISGKVKIGMDENGKPIVQEVTGGSQFITLLPPTGQETFEPGAWYYIVAIPGALEGGYKLRFYKDSDYARKVSEKKVEIKRSIFGSLEKADQGIEFEATTTKFPETREEWEESADLTKSIAGRVREVFSGLISSSSDNTINSEMFISEVASIEGIVDVQLLEPDGGIVLIQNNGVHLNVIYDFLFGQEDNSSQSSPETENRTNSIKRVITPSTGTKTAALFSPFQNWNLGIKDPINIDAYHLGKTLQDYGYNLAYFPNDLTSLKALTPEQLSQYDLIFFVTHGSDKHGIKDQKGKVSETMLFTGQTIDSIDLSAEENKYLAAFLCQNDVVYAITPRWLESIETTLNERASFKKTIVFALACNSYVNDDFADYFTGRGASVYVGDSFYINSDDCKNAVDGLIDYLTMGVSVRNAAEMIKEYFSLFGKLFYPLKVSDEPFGKVYLIDPTPINLHHNLNGSIATLDWDMPKTNGGNYQFKVLLDDILYDTYASKTYTTDSLIPGDYHWYVEANLIFDGRVIESFLSDEGRFSIVDERRYETPEAIDLGLSVKWASFNLGATKPEEYGDYFAWGEVHPYYYTLDPLIWKAGIKSGYNWRSYKWCYGTDDTLTKYYSYGMAQLDSEDDAASVNLGDKWRMPTEKEVKELQENCSFVWTPLNGVNGFLVTSKIAGFTNNSIFLPASGYWESKNLGYMEQSGLYWSSCNNTSMKKNAGYYSFDMNSQGLSYDWIDRCFGLSIRPVCDKPSISGDIEGTERDPWN